MAMTTETVWAALDALLDYAKNCGLLHPLDETFARNTLLSELRLESYEKQEQRFDFPECLNLLCDYAVQQGIFDYFFKYFLRALSPAALECPCLWIVAAAAMVRTALHENGKSHSGAVYYRVIHQPSYFKFHFYNYLLIIIHSYLL